MVSGMVTRIRRGARVHLYITEWRKNRGLTLEQLGNRLGVEKNTVWRWENEQHRVTVDKQAAIADALGLEGPAALFYPPAVQSIDSMLAGQDQATRDMVVDIVSRLIKRA